MRYSLTDEGRPFEVGLQGDFGRLSAAMDKSRGRERERKRPGSDRVRCRARRGLQGNHYGSMEIYGRLKTAALSLLRDGYDGTCLRAERHPAREVA